MHTMSPANRTARPEVSMRLDHGVLARGRAGSACL